MSQLELALIAVVLALGVPSIGLAQSSGGGITGTALASEIVTITGSDSGFHRELKIEKDGKYAIRRVPTGDYVVVTDQQAGFFVMKPST